MGRGGASGNPGIRGAPGDNAICECFLNTHKEVSSKLALSAGEGIKGPRGPSGTQGAKGQPGTAGRPSNVRGVPGITGPKGGYGKSGKVRTGGIEEGAGYRVHPVPDSRFGFLVQTNRPFHLSGVGVLVPG